MKVQHQGPRPGGKSWGEECGRSLCIGQDPAGRVCHTEESGFQQVVGVGSSPGGFKQRLVWLDLDLEAPLGTELWAGASPRDGF